MFLQLSFVCVCASFFSLSLSDFLLEMTRVFYSEMFSLDFLKRTSTKFDRANVSVPEADCASADFTETALFEEETGTGETLFPFLSE